MAELSKEWKGRLESMLFAEEKNTMRKICFGVDFRYSLTDGSLEPVDRKYEILDEQGQPAVLKKGHEQHLFLVRRRSDRPQEYELYKFLPGAGEVCCVPAQITRILEKAFQNCFCLQDVIFAQSGQAICEGAFWNCPQLGSIRIPEPHESYEVWTMSVDTAYLADRNSGTILWYLRKGAAAKVLLPDKTRRIGRGAFSGARELQKVYVNLDLEWIGYQAFDGCTISLSGRPRNCVRENADGTTSRV